jgi:ADP-ribose pyrophosphatase YjhB (NUDIX family)
MNIETPKLAVDVICYHPTSGKIALIERKFPPLGWALPGGFVDIGETVEEAARREMREELNISLKTLQFLGVYSNPKRDPRKHVVSIAFVGIIVDTPVAGDDALNVQMHLPDVVAHPHSSWTLCFDHRLIIQDARIKGLIP